MNLTQALEWRYATKRMNGQKVPRAIVDRILDAVRLAPSSYGLQPYSVLVVESPALREAISSVAYGQPQITEASHLLIFAAWTPVDEMHVDQLIGLTAPTMLQIECLLTSPHVEYICYTCEINGETMDQRLFYLLNSARHRVYKHAEQRCEASLSISVTQLGALLLIARNEGCLLKDLAQSLNLNNSALTGLAGRMEQNGLIERRACELDGRASRLYLTELGRGKIDAAKPLIAQLNAAMTEGFTADEVQIILRFLNRLLSDF